MLCVCAVIIGAQAGNGCERATTSLEEDDKVVLRCTHRGVHTGDFFSLPASGRSFAYRQLHIVRNANGVEHWAVQDDADLMRQVTA